MRIDLISLFPDFVAQIAGHGVVGRAQERALALPCRALRLHLVRPGLFSLGQLLLDPGVAAVLELLELLCQGVFLRHYLGEPLVRDRGPLTATRRNLGRWRRSLPTAGLSRWGPSALSLSSALPVTHCLPPWKRPRPRTLPLPGQS